MKSREEEDRCIARELHDDFSQRLALVAITLERLRLEPTSQLAELSEPLATLQQLVTELGNDLRSLSHRMHPAMLEDLGLVPALRSLAENYDAIRPAPVEFKGEKVPASLSLAHAGAVYRIAQEALNNTMKYAPDAPVVISVSLKGNALRLVVSDDGPGFDTAILRSRNGLGIINMQERAHALGGDVRVQSRPGEGTVITAEIPLPQRHFSAHVGE